jgi:hypothetical protein
MLDTEYAGNMSQLQFEKDEVGSAVSIIRWFNKGPL